MDKMITKIDAVVVLYNPDESIIENIQSYQQINKIYAIDNSEKYDDDLIKKLKQFKNLVYINNNGNKGIANTLNVGAELAIENGVDWLLTMDQDGRFEKDSLNILIDWLCKNDTSNVGIISPYHLTDDQIGIYKKIDTVVNTSTVMTSGNLLNLKAYKKVGKFEEKYFIDYVDHEYCLRFRKNGFKIKVHKNSILIHKLGNISSKTFFEKK